MWFLTAILLLQSAFYIEAEFGLPYLKKNRLCLPWACVANTLGLPDRLPPQDDYETILKSLLPQEWHNVAEKVVDVCYNHRSKEYINTCTGQALLHCTMDNLIENCLENSTRRNDACNPVATTAGMNYMFTQSRYKNLEQNLPKERRPAWFMRQYFDTKCCAVPEIINATVLSECGFRTFLRYYENEPKAYEAGKHYMTAAKPKTTSKKGKKFVPIQKKDGLFEDPFECCDLEDFVSSSWISECDFKLSWDTSTRFTIGDQNVRSTTVTPELITGAVNRDIRVVPLSCSQETCIFEKLNVILESGEVDVNAFSKVLDNFTTLHPSWSKAKARVITQCLTKKTTDYRADCKINELLGCALDVFSENCPHKSRNDLCRHSRRNNTICQISSSKYRPKNRRAVCGLPHLVDSDILTECDVNSVSQIEYVTEIAPKPKNTWSNDYSCQDSSRSTLCLMNKMGVLNKYEFMDYFRMKGRIRSFTANNTEWAALLELYVNVFTALPLYEGYCNSPKKLLNVIDAMVMTCPISKRKNTRRCQKLFDEVITSPPMLQNMTKEKLDVILQNIHNIFTSSKNSSTNPIKNSPKAIPVFDYDVPKPKDAPTSTTNPIKNCPKAIPETSPTNPIKNYPKAIPVFDSDVPKPKDAPTTPTNPIKISPKAIPVFDSDVPKPKDVPIDQTNIKQETKIILEKKPLTKAPLVVLPVYMRMNSTLLNTAQALGPKNGIFQAPPFKLHGKVNSTERLTWKPFFIV